MKSIIYARVSSKEQEETGYSLPSQEKLLSDYSDRKGFETKKVFSVAESASGSKRRKVFAEMMLYMTKYSISHLVVEKVDRLTRNFREAIVINDWIEENPERCVHFVKQNLILHKNSKSDEKFRWDIEIVLAKKYIANLSEEVIKGQKEKLAQGWLPTKPPLGYKTIGDKGHKIHVIDHDKAPLIRRMFELYLTGNYSTKFLVNVMYKEGLRNRNGGKVGKSRLYDLLTDPFVYGKMRWKGEIYNGKHEAIVSEELYDAVQLKINRKLKHPMHRKHLSVFKAKMVCSECNSMITWETQKGHWYGHCSGYQKLGQEKPCTQKKWFRQEKIEEKLFPLLVKVAPRNERVLKLLEKALKEDHEEEIMISSEKRKRLNADLERIDRRMETIYEDKLDRKITEDFYQKKFAEYSTQKEIILKETKRLNEDKTKYYEAGFKVHELALKAKEIYKSIKATDEDRRLLLSYAFTSIDLNDKTMNPKYTLAFEFLANWMPKVNLIYERRPTAAQRADILADFPSRASKDIELSLELPGLGNHFRTAENSLSTTQKGADDTETDSLLRG